MYTVMRAARMSSGSLASAAWKAWAVPWKVARIDGGMAISRSAARIASTAWPREARGARLNEKVTAGNWPWWLMASGASVGVKWAQGLRRTGAPVVDLT